MLTSLFEVWLTTMKLTSLWKRHSFLVVLCSQHHLTTLSAVTSYETRTDMLTTLRCPITSITFQATKNLSDLCKLLMAKAQHVTLQPRTSNNNTFEAIFCKSWYLSDSFCTSYNFYLGLGMGGVGSTPVYVEPSCIRQIY